MHHGTCLNCHCEAPKGPWRPEREARGSALGVQSREGSCDFADGFPIIRHVPRDCHVGLRPPRNDKSGSHHRFSDSPCESFVQRRERHAAPLQWRVRSAECHQTYKSARRSLTAATPHFSAVSVFNGSWYKAAVPARDCHVGLRPPCNDKSGSCTPQDHIFV